MRTSGILLHITSLPSPYGIGTMGACAREFVDFLAAAGQTYWQILPICPTSFGDSPYQSFSTFAGNPYLIDLDDLCAQGLLLPEEYQQRDWGNDILSVDYGKLYTQRYPVLRAACARVRNTQATDFSIFCTNNAHWLDDYALFMALKDANCGVRWQEWPVPIRDRTPAALAHARDTLSEDISFWRAVQYLFFQQWTRLKHYANTKNISFIGDLPIYVAGDSVDVWANPDQFLLDQAHRPTVVAGCPPDGFSADGQLWGNPIFDWAQMQRDGFRWWIERIAYQFSIYDILRIDHFRGFDSYYAIPFGETTARNGTWQQGPGMAFFRAVHAALGPRHIIAEDLGFLTPSVRQLLQDTGYPGMKVLEFAFDSRDSAQSDYLPHAYPTHCVAYTGTHDNDTILGWMEHAPADDVAYAKEYLRLHANEGYHWGMMRALWSSVADTAIVQMQDLLALGASARMNVPSTVGTNWKWRVAPDSFSATLAEKLYRNTRLYGRLPVCHTKEEPT